jgi:hypothetical protein
MFGFALPAEEGIEPVEIENLDPAGSAVSASVRGADGAP